MRPSCTKNTIEFRAFSRQHRPFRNKIADSSNSDVRHHHVQRRSAGEAHLRRHGAVDAQRYGHHAARGDADLPGDSRLTRSESALRPAVEAARVLRVTLTLV